MECSPNTGEPDAQCTALWRRAALQRQEALLQLQDRDGRQEQPTCGLLCRPSAHFRRLVGLTLAQLRNYIGIEKEHYSVKYSGPDLDVQSRWIKLENFSTSNAVHDAEKRRLTMAGDAVVVFNFEKCKSRAPPIRDEHRALGSGPFGRGNVACEVAAGKRVDRHDDVAS